MLSQAIKGYALLLVALPLTGIAQTSQGLDPAPSLDYNQVEIRAPKSLTQKTNSVVVWSEDFSSGIPAGWTNSGTSNGQPSTAVVWEYRGPNTTPNITQGSRGAFSGVGATPPTNSPINSTTASNGFVIFDSDYRDNGGQASNQGGGSGPAPHVAMLTTSAINLSLDSNVILELQSYARVFYANFQVALSSDNGVTWSDTIMVHSNGTLGVNGSSANAEVIRFNVSNAIGGSPNAKLRFIFDGTPGNANGNGYYHWMLDDIAIIEVPQHRLNFLGSSALGGPHYIEYDGNRFEGRYGHVPFNQLTHIRFSSEINNFGSQTQTNVRLQVDIETQGGTNVHSVSTSPTLTLAPGQTALWPQLRTGIWNPTTPGHYNLIFSALSDSINFNTLVQPQSDTFEIWVTDTTSSLDFGGYDNAFGTPNIGDDNSAVASRFDINTNRYASSVDIFLANTTVAGGLIEVTVQDTIGFTFANGFANQPMFYAQHTITAADVAAGKIQVSLRDLNGLPLALNHSVCSSYYVVVTMFSNAGANPISLRNDQTFQQEDRSAIMYYTLSNPRWYTGFVGSLQYNAPHIRLNSSTDCAALIQLGTVNTACSSFTAPSGRVFTQSGNSLYDTVPSSGSNTCDSIYVFDLNLNAIGTTTGSFCQGQSYIFPDGRTISQPGTYRDTIVGGGAFGCDSLYDITLDYLQLSVPIQRNNNVLSVALNPAVTTFQWYYCSQFGLIPIQGDTASSYTVTQNGDYAVVVSSQGCSDTIGCYTVDDISTSEFENAGVSIYPIPANASIYISNLEGASINRVELIDAFGRMVGISQPNASEVNMTTSHLSSGLYLLKITDSNDHLILKKILIRH